MKPWASLKYSKWQNNQFGKLFFVSIDKKTSLSQTHTYMRILQMVKRFWYHRALATQIAPTKNTIERHIFDPRKVRHVAIVFDATTLQERKNIEQWIETFRNAGKRVSILAFLNQKEPQRALPYPNIARQQINWYGVPTGTAVDIFLTGKYDLLIAAHTTEHLTLSYLATRCEAKFKVGATLKEVITPRYDLAVACKQKNDIQGFIHQINNLFNKMQPPVTDALPTISRHSHRLSHAVST